MLKRLAVSGAVVLSIICGLVTVAYADTLKSNNFQIDESYVGGGGLLQSSSQNYKVDDAVGDIGVGDASSANYQINSGYITDGNPALAFTVNNAATFGNFSTGAATVTTSTFQVSNYTSYGYVVQILGAPPSNNTHTLTAMSTTGVSQAGVEQFGINLVANTSPVSFGANPDHGQFGFGSASANYGSANNFRYVSGETIASAPKSSGVTTYTISYLVNVSNTTPGGQYAGNQVLICTGTY